MARDPRQVTVSQSGIFLWVAEMCPCNAMRCNPSSLPRRPTLPCASLWRVLVTLRCPVVSFPHPPFLSACFAFLPGCPVLCLSPPPPVTFPLLFPALSLSSLPFPDCALSLPLCVCYYHCCIDEQARGRARDTAREGKDGPG